MVYWWIPKVFMLWQICVFCKCIVCGFKNVGYILYKIVYFSWRLIVFWLFIFIYFYEDIIVYFNWYVLLIFVLRKFFLFFKPVYKITSSDKTLYYQDFSQFYVPPGSIFSKLIFWEVFLFRRCFSRCIMQSARGNPLTLFCFARPVCGG